MADLGGAPPYGPKFSQFHSVFCKIWQNHTLVPPLKDWHPLLRWILRARDRDRDILARLRFGHQRPLNRWCPARLGHQRPVNRGCPRVSKPVSQDIQSICYCLHTGIFHLDTCDLVVAGVRISISPKYLYLYLALKVLTSFGESWIIRKFTSIRLETKNIH